jgi:hypothetical protein
MFAKICGALYPEKERRTKIHPKDLATSGEPVQPWFVYQSALIGVK